MGQINVYVDDDLHEEMKKAKGNWSKIAQTAFRAELSRNYWAISRGGTAYLWDRRADHMTPVSSMHDAEKWADYANAKETK